MQLKLGWTILGCRSGNRGRESSRAASPTGRLHRKEIQDGGTLSFAGKHSILGASIHLVHVTVKLIEIWNTYLCLRYDIVLSRK